MDANEKHLIRNNLDKLIRLIDFDQVLPGIINKSLLDERTLNYIKSIDAKKHRMNTLLIDITYSQMENAFDSFFEILLGTGHEEAARLLRPDAFRNDRYHVEDVISDMMSASSIAESAVDGGGDGGSHTVGTIQSEENLMKVMSATQMMSGKDIYKMSSYPRGFCLIINNIEFDNNIFRKRDGSESEANRLRDVFNELHFDVKVKSNLSYEKLVSELKAFSRHSDLPQHDAFVLIVLSHGDCEVVYTSDGLSIKFEEIVRLFNNDNCRGLINKPKLFFFNCCRGGSHDYGPKELQVDRNAVPDASKIIIPLASDILICYSTIDGFVSWRNEESGSWFGTALSLALMRHSHDTDLSRILTITADMVRNKVTLDGARQTMEWTCRGWTKILYFNPGFPRVTQL